MGTRRECVDARPDVIDTERDREEDGPAPGLWSASDSVGGRDDGGGASRGITGEAGVGDLGPGDCEAIGAPLRPASIAGIGVDIAMGNEGGGAK